ncbi:MAG: hypothetical protein J3R72DRAFT_478560 [Linnemannia gamsii]|nr:MAG: hypothetical protein J3R72DRAFT_478560 [Linnemannia gamsii]
MAGFEDEDLPAKRKTTAKQMQDITSSDDEGEDLVAGQKTPPKQLQGNVDEVPLVKELQASFHHDSRMSKFTLSDKDQDLYNEAAKWFRSKMGRDTESVIQNLRDDRFWEPWEHDLLYDRLSHSKTNICSNLLFLYNGLKLLRTGLDSRSDENTYTSFWIVPDFVALQTGVPGLISKGFVNENHFTPSAWRRALSRGKTPAKSTNVDAYYVARDNYVDIIFENVGSPACTDHSKHEEDKEKLYRNAADALVERFYNTSGSFEIAKGYSVIIVIVFGHDLSIYTTNIKDVNKLSVSRVFQGKYHFSKDVYLTDILLHLNFCLTIKSRGSAL